MIIAVQALPSVPSRENRKNRRPAHRAHASELEWHKQRRDFPAMRPELVLANANEG